MFCMGVSVRQLSMLPICDGSHRPESLVSVISGSRLAHCGHGKYSTGHAVFTIMMIVIDKQQQGDSAISVSGKRSESFGTAAGAETFRCGSYDYDL